LCSTGFDLLVKEQRSAPQTFRVRPVFAAGWKVNGSIAVWDEQIGEALGSFSNTPI
jgi:hypothetical protein